MLLYASCLLVNAEIFLNIEFAVQNTFFLSEFSDSYPLAQADSILIAARAAATALKSGDACTAIALYTDMLPSSKHRASILFNRSLAYSQSGEHSLAAQDLQQVPCSLQ